MRLITTAAELWAVQGQERHWPLGYVVLRLPSGEYILVWVRGLNNHSATYQHLLHLQAPTPVTSLSDRTRSLLVRCCLIDPERWRLQPEELSLRAGRAPRLLESPDPPEQPRQLFSSIGATAALGDPLIEDAPAHHLMDVIAVASGWPSPEPDLDAERQGHPAETLEQLQANLAGDAGCWVPGIFRSDREAALYIRPFDEAELRQAQFMTACRDLRLKDVEDVVVPPRGAPYIVSRCLLTGPGGPPVLGEAEADRLGYGLAYYIQCVADVLQPVGGPVETRFPGEADLDDDADGGGPADVVDGGAVTPTPAGAAGSEPGPDDSGGTGVSAMPAADDSGGGGTAPGGPGEDGGSGETGQAGPK